MFVGRGAGFLAGVSVKRLELKYSVESDVKAKLRLQVALLRKRGESQPFISSVTGLPMTTVSSILWRFEMRGVEGCYAIKQMGQPRRLGDKQRSQLKAAGSDSPQKVKLPFVVWTTKLVQYFIQKKYKVSYTRRQVHNILVRFNFSLQKPRPEHIKANKVLQKGFKKNSDEKLRHLQAQDMRSSFWTNQYSP